MRTCTTAALISALLTGSLVAQSSDYYLVEGGGRRTAYVLRDGAIARQWPTIDDHMPLAVADTVRTYGLTFLDRGAEYTREGEFTGVIYTYQNEENLGHNVDGGTDGIERNFLAGYLDGGIWSYDRDWTNPQRLFAAPTAAGVTWDHAHGTLWVIQLEGTRIAEYTLDGVLLDSFTYSTPSTFLAALAYERATDTLWAGEFDSGTFYQFSKTGRVLDQFTIPELAGSIWGGEFAAAGGVACHYRLKKSKPKGGCDACPRRGDDYATPDECESKRDCRKTLKSTIPCPGGGNGVCKLKGKRSGCN